MTYPDIGQPEQSLMTQETYHNPDQYGPTGYYDAYAGKPPAGWNAQMMQALFSCKLPDKNDDFENSLELIRTAIEILPKIPNYDAATYHELNRDFEDIIDRAHSEGRRRVVASKMCKMILKLRSLVPRGDYPLVGISGVSALISSRVQSEQVVKMPKQDDNGGGSFGFRWPYGRK